LGLWSTYVVDGGKEDLGRIDDTMEMILPVTGDTQMVAGEITSESSGRVSTALVDTRTMTGPPLAGAAETADMMGFWGKTWGNAMRPESWVREYGRLGCR
jgi:hypothetical protein